MGLISIPAYYRQIANAAKRTESRRRNRIKKCDPLGIAAKTKPVFNKAAFANLLKATPTKAESILKQPLRGMGFVFQPVIHGYIPDFAHIQAKLIVEADGSVHAKRKHYDQRRDGHLRERGYRVIRFRNIDIFKQLPKVLAEIRLNLETIIGKSGDENGVRVTASKS